nr:YSIRK-type signal peptide-containing protein [Streptococcus canis]
MEKAKQMKYHLRKSAFGLAAVLASAQVKTRAQTKTA